MAAAEMQDIDDLTRQINLLANKMQGLAQTLAHAAPEPAQENFGNPGEGDRRYDHAGLPLQ